MTRQSAIFATFHVPTVHPVRAAKEVATIDHISRGRFGLNIVAGWNYKEIGMFGIEQREHTLFNLSRVDGVRNPGAGWKWRFHIGGRYFKLRNRAYGLRRRLRGA